MTIHQLAEARAKHQQELSRRAFPLHGPRIISNVCAVWPMLWGASWAFWGGVHAAMVKGWRLK